MFVVYLSQICMNILSISGFDSPLSIWIALILHARCLMTMRKNSLLLFMEYNRWKDNNIAYCSPQILIFQMQDITESIVKLEQKTIQANQEMLLLRNKLSLLATEKQNLESQKKFKEAQVNDLLKQMTDIALKQQKYTIQAMERVKNKIQDKHYLQQCEFPEKRQKNIIQDFTYIINDPEQFECLGDKIEQLEEREKGLKKARQDQIRTIKINISLAQIQLKELLALKKKK